MGFDILYLFGLIFIKLLKIIIGLKWTYMFYLVIYNIVRHIETCYYITYYFNYKICIQII